MGALPDFDSPRTRVALDLLDLAIARDLGETFVDDRANGASKHCLKVVGVGAREILANTRARTLDQLARRRGYRQPEEFAEPGHGKRSAILQHQSQAHAGAQVR